MNQFTLPESAQVVVIGGGVAGTSLAYHLVALGWRDVVVLEQNRLGGGTTWHAAGMVSRFRASNSQVRISKDSTRLYQALAQETGIDVGWREVGSLLLAGCEDRMTQYARTAAMAEVLGVESHRLTAAECGERFPGIRTDDLVGGFWVPGDGRVLPGQLPLALAAGATRGGAKVLEGVRVEALLHKGRRVTGVRTDHGEIRAEKVVLAGGMWSRQLAAAAGIAVPLHPVEHHYVVSNPVPGMTGSEPCTRDMNGSIYFRGEDVDGGGGAVMLGAFQRTTKIWDVRRVPDDFSFGLLEPDWEKFQEPLDAGIHRVPALKVVGFAKFVNGPESFTPDNQWLMGEVSEMAGVYLLTGFNSVGIVSGGGAGKALADWMVGGEMPFDLTPVDIRRFGAWANNTTFLRERVTESLGLHYQMGWPNRESVTGRGMRRSPLHDRWMEEGACFGVKAGWERPNWFARLHGRGVGEGATQPFVEYSFGRQNWFGNHRFEHLGCRDRVALFDQTGFAKLRVQGPDAVNLLQRVCGNDVDVAVGRAVYTGWFNSRGTFESDLTVIRMGEDDFYLVTGSAQGGRDLDWLNKHRLETERVSLSDVTAGWGVLGVMGPASRALLSGLTETDLSLEAFPFGTSQSIGVSSATVRAVRMTYVGELGWELHVPMDQMCLIFEALREKGEEHGLVLAGHYAINSLRLEKGYRAFGSELSPDETPLEAGLGFAVAWDKAGGFIGRDALLRLREQPLKKRLVSILLEDDQPVLWGGEPIRRDEITVGYTTSGAYGHSLGGAVGLGYLRHPDGATVDWVQSGRYSVRLADQWVPARVSVRPLFDPARTRILC
jgi:4-methylaminobutanoate oxidase (formaldehyde-forming)